MVGNDNSKTISIKISVEVEPQTQIDRLFAKERLQNSNKYISAELLSSNNTLAFDGSQLVEYLISFSIGVASGVVGNCIYNAIHTMAKKIEINGHRTRLTEENITQAIETIKALVDATDSKNGLI